MVVARALALAFTFAPLAGCGGAALGLEELVDDALGFVGFAAGARRVGGNEGTLSAVDAAGIKGYLEERLIGLA